MQLIIFVLLICFFVFLYILYYLSKDDFVIVRKDIQIERIFNLAILTSIFSLFCSRLSYVIFNPSPKLLSPLGFFAIPYFPGLSLIGGLIGGSLFLYFYSKYRNFPVGKIFDLFIMSVIGVLPVGFLLVFLVLLGNTSLSYNILFVVSILILFLFSKIIFPFSLKGEIKDGSLGLIFLLIFSFSYFITNLFLNIKTFSFFTAENILVLVSLFTCLILLINIEIMNKFFDK